MQNMHSMHNYIIDTNYAKYAKYQNISYMQNMQKYAKIYHKRTHAYIYALYAWVQVNPPNADREVCIFYMFLCFYSEYVEIIGSVHM